MLSRFLASVAVADGLTEAVVEGRTLVRAAVEVVRAAGVAEVAVLEAVLVLLAVVVDAGFLSAADPMTLVRRSAVDEVFVGARVDGVPASDMRFAALEMPFFSSPELATFEDFSSAELLIEGRER